MFKKLLCLTTVLGVISLPAIAFPVQSDEYQESIGEYQGVTDNGDALYLRKTYPDKHNTGITGFRYYVIGHGMKQMNIATTQYCKTHQPNWTIDNGDGLNVVLIQATSKASKNLLNAVCNFPQGT